MWSSVKLSFQLRRVQRSFSTFRPLKHPSNSTECPFCCGSAAPRARRPRDQASVCRATVTRLQRPPGQLLQQQSSSQPENKQTDVITGGRRVSRHVQDATVQDSSVQDLLVQDLLVQDSLLQNLLVQDLLVQDSLVQDSLVQKSRV